MTNGGIPIHPHQNLVSALYTQEQFQQSTHTLHFSKVSTCDRRKICQSYTSDFYSECPNYPPRSQNLHPQRISKYHQTPRDTSVIHKFESDPTLRALFNSQCPSWQTLPQNVSSFVISPRSSLLCPPGSSSAFFFFSKPWPFLLRKLISIISISVSKSQFSRAKKGKIIEPKTLNPLNVSIWIRIHSTLRKISSFLQR